MELEVGDEVWFFYTIFGNDRWGEGGTIIYPSEIEFLSGNIIKIDKDKDCVLIKVLDYDNPVYIGYTFFEDWIYSSKEGAIQGMINQMQELKNS